MEHRNKSTFHNLIILTMIDTVRNFMNQLSDFDQLAFKGYYNISSMRFKQEFFSDEHKKILRSCLNKCWGLDNDHASNYIQSTNLISKEKQRDFFETIFGLLFTIPNATLEHYQAAFKECFPEDLDVSFENYIREKTESVVITPKEELRVKLSVMFFDELTEKSYKELPLFKDAYFRDLVTCEDYSSFLKMIIRIKYRSIDNLII